MDWALLLGAPPRLQNYSRGAGARSSILRVNRRSVAPHGRRPPARNRRSEREEHSPNRVPERAPGTASENATYRRIVGSIPRRHPYAETLAGSATSARPDRELASAP